MVDYTEGEKKQYHVGLKQGDVGRYVILPGDPKRSAKIAAYFDDPVQVGDNREYVTYTGTLLGEKVSVTSTGIGGPSASIAVEELVNLGAEVFIRVGTCGGMDLNVKGGDVIVATSAVRMEGTSKEYAPIEFPAVADLQVTNALYQAAQEIAGEMNGEFRCHTGTVECKDSFYGQHQPEKMPVSYELQNKWEAWLRMGCLGSEMESAAIFIVSAYRHVKAGTVLLAIANQEREKQGLPNAQVHDTDRAIRIAIRAIEKMIRDDKK